MRLQSTQSEIPTHTGQGFGKERRLLRRHDYNVVFQRGFKRVGGSIIVLARFSHRAEGRLGLVVSKKVGNAVVRNLVKRRLRELYRRADASLKQLAARLDVVVIARAGAHLLLQEELSQHFWEALRRLRQKMARPRRNSC